MVEINLPYDKKMITARIPDKNFIGLLESKAEHFSNPYTEKETVEKSLDNPIGSLPLEELAKGKKDIVLISSDHTRVRTRSSYIRPAIPLQHPLIRTSPIRHLT